MRLYTLLLSLFLLVGCVKEESLTTPSSTVEENVTTNDQKVELLSKAYAVIKEHENNADIQFRSTEKFTVNEAKWSLEAIANVTFAQRVDGTDKINSSDFSLTVPKSDGLISETDLANAYFQIHDKIVEHYNRVNTQSKYVYNVYLTIVGSTNNSVQLSGTTHISENNSATAVNCGEVFSDGSHHKFGFNSGLNCDDEENLLAHEAWDLELKALIDEGTHIPSPYPNAPYFAGFVTPFAIEDEFLAYIDYEVPNPDYDGYRDYLFYVYDPSINVQEDLCINDEEMNWYLCNYYDVGLNHRPYDEETFPYYLANANVLEDLFPCGNGCVTRFVSLEVSYGEPIFVSDGPGYVDPNDVVAYIDFDEMVIGMAP